MFLPLSDQQLAELKQLLAQHVAPHSPMWSELAKLRAKITEVEAETQTLAALRRLAKQRYGTDDLEVDEAANFRVGLTGGICVSSRQQVAFDKLPDEDLAKLLILAMARIVVVFPAPLGPMVFLHEPNLRVDEQID